MTLINRCTLLLFVLTILLSSCSRENNKTLPFLGIHQIEEKDTLYYTLPSYEFTRQDSTQFGSKNLKGKPYIAYFFFTSCPSVCPRMTQGGKRVQQALLDKKDDFNIVAFSIDPDRDNLSKLNSFASEYGVDFKNWHFLRGLEKDIFKISEKSFYVGIDKNKDEPGGYMHSEKMILVDATGHLRGYYSGTDANGVKSLITDLGHLMKENAK